MRKFLIRWWYTPNWEQDAMARMNIAEPWMDYCGRGMTETLKSAVTKMLVYDNLFAKPIPFSQASKHGLLKD